MLGLTLCGCAATKADTRAELQPRHSIREFSDQPFAVVADPWEGFNRNVYRFNFYLDKYLFLPVVRGYEFVTPAFLQQGVSNFYNNIGEVRTLTNSLLQGKGTESAKTLGRFLTNSTVGLGGLFDPATKFGLERQYEDFGKTLGHWGAGSGPYLVLPVFGPSSARDAGGARGGLRDQLRDLCGGGPLRQLRQRDGRQRRGGDPGRHRHAAPAELPLLRERLPLRVLHGQILLPREARDRVRPLPQTVKVRR